MIYPNGNNGYHGFSSSNNDSYDDGYGSVDNTTPPQPQHDLSEHVNNAPFQNRSEDNQNYADEDQLLYDFLLSPPPFDITEQDYTSNDSISDRIVPNDNSSHPSDDFEPLGLLPEDYDDFEYELATIFVGLDQSLADPSGNEVVSDQSLDNLHQPSVFVDYYGNGSFNGNIAEENQAHADNPPPVYVNQQTYANNNFIRHQQFESFDPSFPSDFLMQEDEMDSPPTQNEYLSCNDQKSELVSNQQQCIHANTNVEAVIINKQPPKGNDNSYHCPPPFIHGDNSNDAPVVGEDNESNEYPSFTSSEISSSASSSTTPTTKLGRPEIYKTEKEKRAAKNVSSKKYEKKKKDYRLALEAEVLGLEEENQNLDERLSNCINRYMQLQNLGMSEADRNYAQQELLRIQQMTYDEVADSESDSESDEDMS